MSSPKGKGKGAVDVAGVAMRLQFDRDHLALLRQLVEHLAEGIDHAEAAVHHDERGAATATALPIHLDPVDGCIPSGQRLSHLVLLVAAPGVVLISVVPTLRLAASQGGQPIDIGTALWTAIGTGSRHAGSRV
jgi:hypothetical protein